MGEHLSQLALDLNLHENVLIDAVVVIQIVRIKLIEPARRARVGIASKDPRSPLVVTRTLIRIPRTWICGSVENQVELGIVGDPAPDRRAAGLPRIAIPAMRAQINSAVVRRFECILANQHVRVGTDIPRRPQDLTGIRVETLDPSVDAEFAPGGADNDAILDDHRRHADGLSTTDLGDVGLPQLLARRGVHRDRVTVQQVIEKLAVRVEGPAIDGIAAGHADCVWAHVRPVFPL
jgi:hypothetical protein